MVKLSDQVKSIIIIASVLLITLFYESKRIETLAIGIENSSLKNIALSYSSGSEKIKTSLGLNTFFDKDQFFWKGLKKSPMLLNNQLRENIVDTNPNQSPSPTPKEILPFKIEAPYNFLIVGDSFVAERFGYQIEKELISYKDTTVNRKGVYSTGLSRPDYFDWDKEINDLINSYKPNIAIVMFGANDGQDLRTLDGKVIHYGEEAWNIEYSKRVASFLQNLTKNEVFVFWIGNPIPRDDYYSKKMQTLNSIYEDECKKNINALYVSTWYFLADSNGKFTNYLPDETGNKKLARTSDGIHVTVFGANIIVKKVVQIIMEKISLEVIRTKNGAGN